MGIKVDKFERNFLFKLMLRCYAFYSFGSENQPGFTKIVKTITTKQRMLKVQQKCSKCGVVRIFGGESVMKRLIQLSQKRGGENTITMPPMLHSGKLQHRPER